MGLLCQVESHHGTARNAKKSSARRPATVDTLSLCECNAVARACLPRVCLRAPSRPVDCSILTGSLCRPMCDMTGIPRRYPTVQPSKYQQQQGLLIYLQRRSHLADRNRWSCCQQRCEVTSRCPRRAGTRMIRRLEARV